MTRAHLCHGKETVRNRRKSREILSIPGKLFPKRLRHNL
jgi:hypothetical protein